MHKTSSQDWKKLEEFAQKQAPLEELHQKSFSIIIPTYNCSELIGVTIERILAQSYQQYEVLVIDANSKDQTREIVLGFQNSKVKLYTVGQYNRFKMLNKGLSLAGGEYVNFLFPGDYYRSNFTLSHICSIAWESNSSELIYAGSILRYPRSEPIPFFHSLTKKNLKKAIQPSTLPSCWFLTSTLKKIGKFDPSYQYRSALDLFCRFYLVYKGSIAQTKRFLIDRDKQAIPQKNIFIRFKDTCKILYRYFGFLGICQWLLTTKDWRVLWTYWALKVRRIFVQ